MEAWIPEPRNRNCNLIYFQYLYDTLISNCNKTSSFDECFRHIFKHNRDLSFFLQIKKKYLTLRVKNKKSTYFLNNISIWFPILHHKVRYTKKSIYDVKIIHSLAKFKILLKFLDEYHGSSFLKRRIKDNIVNCRMVTSNSTSW